VDFFIQAVVRQRFQAHFPHGIDEWKDVDGQGHKYEERASFAGSLPKHGVDSQRTGRAIAREDISRLVFGGKFSSAVKRKNPRKVNLTADSERKASERRALQLVPSSSMAIEAVSFSRAEMLDLLKLYAKQEGAPLSITAALQGSKVERELYMPPNHASRPLLAAALSRWRLLASALCAKAHASLVSAQNPFDQLVSAEKTMVERRTAARSRLRLGGKLTGLPMRVAVLVENNQADPLGAMSAWFEKNDNLRRENAVDAMAVAEAAPRECCVQKEAPPRNEPKFLHEVSRVLNANTNKKGGAGRAAQMSAARSFRRTAEIQLLIEERKKARERNITNSPWRSGALEPPAASIGNAASWTVPSKSPTAPLASERGTPTTRRTQPTEAQISTGRRPPMCSCCGLVRTKGHVQACSHTNKVCSKCRKAKGE
jgi:hypothetical protein